MATPSTRRNLHRKQSGVEHFDPGLRTDAQQLPFEIIISTCPSRVWGCWPSRKCSRSCGLGEIGSPSIRASGPRPDTCYPAITEMTFCAPAAAAPEPGRRAREVESCWALPYTTMAEPVTFLAVSFDALPKKATVRLLCQLRGLFVVARRGVVVEAVVGARVEVDLVFLAVGLREPPRMRPAGVDALVELPVVNLQRRLDPRYVFSRDLSPVERNRRRQVSGSRAARPLQTPPP